MSSRKGVRLPLYLNELEGVLNGESIRAVSAREWLGGGGLPPAPRRDENDGPYDTEETWAPHARECT